MFGASPHDSGWWSSVSVAFIYFLGFVSQHPKATTESFWSSVNWWVKHCCCSMPVDFSNRSSSAKMASPAFSSTAVGCVFTIEMKRNTRWRQPLLSPTHYNFYSDGPGRGSLILWGKYFTRTFTKTKRLIEIWAISPLSIYQVKFSWQFSKIQSLLSIRQVGQSVFYFSYIKSKFCSDVQEYLPTYAWESYMVVSLWTTTTISSCPSRHTPPRRSSSPKPFKFVDWIHSETITTCSQ